MHTSQVDGIINNKEKVIDQSAFVNVSSDTMF